MTSVAQARREDEARVTFRFYRPHAVDVKIAGDFNDWRGDWAMTHEGDGWWSACAELPSGDYRFRYVADGSWYTDFAASGIEYTKFGTNSILTVPDLRTKQNIQTAETRSEETIDIIRHTAMKAA